MAGKLLRVYKNSNSLNHFLWVLILNTFQTHTTESLKLFDKIIISYVKKEWERLKLEPSQPALLILDVFSGQMTTSVTGKLAENHVKCVKVPANMTDIFQLLDLTINRSAKFFMKKKYTEWYSLEVMKQVDSGKNEEEIEVKLLLSKLITLHASWLIVQSFYSNS